MHLVLPYLANLGLKYTWNVLMKENSDLMWRKYSSCDWYAKVIQTKSVQINKKDNEINNATLSFNKIKT